LSPDAVRARNSKASLGADRMVHGGPGDVIDREFNADVDVRRDHDDRLYPHHNTGCIGCSRGAAVVPRAIPASDVNIGVWRSVWRVDVMAVPDLPHPILLMLQQEDPTPIDYKPANAGKARVESVGRSASPR
jgi:hypothetical protein